MAIFCYQKITPPRSLGEQFCAAREKSGESRAALAARLQIPSKYLAALESNNFAALPRARVFRHAYVAGYAAALGLESATCLMEFDRAGGAEEGGMIHPHTTIKLFPFASVSMLVRNLVLAGFVLIFVGYLGWQLKGIIKPPRLVVYAPLEGDVSATASVAVQGETQPETRLTINGQTVVVSATGLFNAKIDAVEGVNTIIIAATAKHGKITTVTRHVVVRGKRTEQVSLGSFQKNQ